MFRRKKLLLVLASALILVGMMLGVLALTASAPQARSCAAITAEVANITVKPRERIDRGLIIGSPPGDDSQPLRLITVVDAARAVNDGVLVPDVSCLGAGYRVIGVQVAARPEVVTANNGYRFKHWLLNFFISDKPFVNGETLLSDLSGHLIIVSEIPSTGYNNSYGAALNTMGFSEACESGPNGNQCTLVPNPGSGQLIHIRDTYIVLHPEAPDAYLQIDCKLNRVIWIDGGQGNITYQQLLTLADTMLTATLFTAQPAEIDVAPSTLVLLGIIVVATTVFVAITIQERKEQQRLQQ